MRRTLAVLTVGALTAALSPLAAQPGASAAGAAAAADRRPPTVVLDPWARPLVGAQVEVIHVPDEGFTYWQTDFRIRWVAADRSGICAQEVGWSSYDALGEEIDPHLGAPTTWIPVSRTARSFVATGLDPFDWSRVRDRFVVKVTDCAGNTSFSNVADSQFGIREDDDASIRYRGRWRTATSEGYAGGTSHTTVRRGSSARIRFSGGAPVALIMSTGPHRGRAIVHVDGIRRAVVNTWSATPRHRVIVWQGLFPAGRHTLRLVNRATPGHPRITLDAVSTCPGAGSCLTGG